MYKKISAVILSLLMLTACGEEEVSSGKNYAFTYVSEGNPQNLDPQLAQDKASLEIIENTFSGLTATDENGVLTYGVAEKCNISEDGKVYTFTLRKDIMWYDGTNAPYPVTAKDFVFAFQRIFNPVTCSPYKDTFSFIKNGQKIINGQKDYTEIGVTAPDDYTVIFTLDSAEPRFMEMLATAPAMPCNQEFFESTKARYGLDDESVISNGSFYIQQWFYDPYGNDNFLYMRRNAHNNSDDSVLPYSINVVIEKDKESISENFKQGEYDCLITETPSEFNGIVSRNFEVNEYVDKTVGIFFSSDIDMNLKSALASSVDREEFSKMLTSTCQVAYGIIPPAMRVSDILYREYADEKMLNYYNLESAIKYSSKFQDRVFTVITCKEYVETTYIEKITAEWEEKLGVSILTEELSLEEYKKRIRNGDYQMAAGEISAGYDNPYDIFKKFENENISELLNSCANVNSNQKRQEYYFEIEKKIIGNSEFIPLYYKKTYCIFANNSDDIVYNPFTEEINFKYAKNYS